jgi:hypothetical protein
LLLNHFAFENLRQAYPTTKTPVKTSALAVSPFFVS